MTINELKLRLRDEGCSDWSYRLNYDNTFSECYILSRSGEQWQVLHRERGDTDILSIWESEEEACDEFLRVMLKDPMTRR